MHIYVHITKTEKTGVRAPVHSKLHFVVRKYQGQIYIFTTKTKKTGVRAPVYFKLHLIVRKYQGQIYAEPPRPPCLYAPPT